METKQGAMLYFKCSMGTKTRLDRWQNMEANSFEARASYLCLYLGKHSEGVSLELVEAVYGKASFSHNA